ncbi:hypothetical protein MHUMG1_00287 [Metarhizium humberi]|uniref:Uncharacterized protein n=1 Tax=Metarhizium humberi TaxID=2596975 RepID=A0A9P8SCA4_9HYPO|nr:hypothetical protein MHUMG1_00287 [Metarhizium humberi]
MTVALNVAQLQFGGAIYILVAPLPVLRVAGRPGAGLLGAAQDPAGAQAADGAGDTQRGAGLAAQPGHGARGAGGAGLVRVVGWARARAGAGGAGGARAPVGGGARARHGALRGRARGALLLRAPAVPRALALPARPQGPPPLHGARGLCLAVRAPRGAPAGECAAGGAAADVAARARRDHVGVCGVPARRDGDGAQRLRFPARAGEEARPAS